MALNPTFAKLLNSRWLIKAIDSSAPQFTAFLEFVADCLRADPRVYSRVPLNPDSFLRALGVILLNLLYVRFSDPPRYVALSMSAGAYRQDRHGFGYKTFRRALEGLCNQGLCSRQRGFLDRTTGKGRVGRIRATPEIMELAAAFGVGPGCITLPPREPVVELRAPKEMKCTRTGKWKVVLPKEPLDWPDDEPSRRELVRMEANLKQINDHLRECFIGLHVSDATIRQINDELLKPRNREQLWARPEVTWVDFHRRQLHRVFSEGNIRRGGRFYGAWWQSIPKAYRKYIHIAKPGERPQWTVEYDYGALHPSLLYARLGRVAPENCYTVVDPNRYVMDRAYAKQGMLTLLNASSRQSAELALQRWILKRFDTDWYAQNPDVKRPYMPIAKMIPQGNPGIRELLDELTSYHHPIRQYFCAGVANELMYTDSCIAERVMLRLLAEGITVLPIHDSFLVRGEYGRELLDAMQECFIEVAGVPPRRIDAAATELSLAQEDARVKWQELTTADFLSGIEAERAAADSIYWTHRRDWEAVHPAYEVEKVSKRTEANQAIVEA